MKLKSIVLLTVALGCGLVAMLGVQQVLSGDSAAKAEEKAKVLIATTDIPPGTLLDDKNTMFKAMAMSDVPDGAVTKPEEYEERATRVTAVPGEIIMKAKLGEKGFAGASTEIPEGMRVVTVSVNLTKTHSGLIMPGNRVDVLVTYKMRSKENGMVTKTRTVLEYIKVFAADSIRKSGVEMADTAEIDAKNISLLVDPEQAQLLLLAQTKGQLYMTLRRDGDDATVETRDISDVEFEEMFKTRGQDDEIVDVSDEDSKRTVVDVREFIEQKVETEPQVAETEVVVEPKPEPKTWTLTIYRGDQVSVEEVVLPLPEKPAEAAAVETPSESGDSDNVWSNWLESMFTTDA